VKVIGLSFQKKILSLRTFQSALLRREDQLLSMFLGW